MRYLLVIFILFIVVFPSKTLALSSPLEEVNNKYGIHIIDENDLDNAAALVNSSGGDWGYVTLVITENQRNVNKWNEIFKKMQQLHLIPIVRLATQTEGDYWRKPFISDVPSWVNFLSQLTWVIKNRYIILFNEPNHAKEWGNEINPVEYANLVKEFSQKLKASSDDFFVLPAGLDASAPNSLATMDELDFLKKIFLADPDFAKYIDGWVSHSYPNPGFVGKVESTGRGTLQTYRWELNFLKAYGLPDSLPVFITETGWPHQEGDIISSHFFSAELVAKFITDAANSVWDDEQIVAITPFVLNYQSYPFSNFSWQQPASDRFYDQYDSYRSLPKLAGKPILNKQQYVATDLTIDKKSDTSRQANFTNKDQNLFSRIFKSLRKLPFLSKYIFITG